MMADAKIATSKNSDERRATCIQQSASRRPPVSMAFPVARQPAAPEASGLSRSWYGAAEAFTDWSANLVRLMLVNIGH